MFRVLGGADATGGFMQHEIPRRFAGLQQHVITFNATESPYFMVWIADDAAIDPYPFFDQEQADLLAAELGQVAQKTVYAHSDQSQGIQPNILREVLRLRWLQLAQNVRAARAETRQIALLHWQGTDDFWVDSHAVAPAGLAWVQSLRAPQAGQRSGVVMSGVRCGAGVYSSYGNRCWRCTQGSVARVVQV